MFFRVHKFVTGLIAAATILGCLSSAWAVVSVRGYTRKDGTYVAPHHRSNPDGNFYNNWSTKGNVNPYTGKPGTRVTPPGGNSRSFAARRTDTLANRTNSEVPGIGDYSGDDDDYEAARRSQDDRWKKLADRRKREPTDIRLSLADDERLQHFNLSADLKASGVNLSWRLYTPDRLNTMKERVAAAERVAALGLDMPWQLRTVEQLENLEQQLMATDGDERQRVIDENSGVEGLWWQLDR